MARIVLTTVLIVLLNVMVGCKSVDSGSGQLMPAVTKTTVSAAAVKVAGSGEVDVVEQVTVNRQAYRQTLKTLIDYYAKTGNDMKLEWAKKELEELNAIPQYKYIIEAEVAGPNLKATASIPEADMLFKEARYFEEKGGRLIVIKDQDLLRLALDKYNELIRKYPTSDKIDDAAYMAGGIYEYFKDYSIALLYYERTYQWDAETSYPAKFKEAYILDQRMHRRSEALELYKQAIAANKVGMDREWVEWAEKRVKEMSKSGGEKVD